MDAHLTGTLGLAITITITGCAEHPLTRRIDPDGARDAGLAQPAPIDAALADARPSDAAPLSPPGARCACDAECAGDFAHPGVCVYGICMTRASTTECTTAGSRHGCGDGSRCWRVRDTSEAICWPDCDAFVCDGTCDSDGSCVGRGALDCDPACGSFCASAPATGACPAWECRGEDCTELIQLPGSTDPDDAISRELGYYVDTRERYTYLRRDLVMLLQHATCEVARRFPGTAPLGIQDLSQADGLTPGTDIGDPRHPTSTHRGSDLDLSYYQTDGDNDAHIVCGDGSDTNGNGRRGTFNDGYFCTTEENIVDWEREAYFFAMLGTSPLVRVFGVDTTFVDDLEDELDRQRALGWITTDQHARASDLGSGASGGWQFHHHHSHMSFSRP
jgi:hypothetical protein